MYQPCHRSLAKPIIRKRVFAVQTAGHRMPPRIDVNGRVVSTHGSKSSNRFNKDNSAVEMKMN